MFNEGELASTAQRLVALGKGILAADESTPTIGKRLGTINVESTPDVRREYRELLFTATGLGEFLSGVILYDETIRQRAASGASFVDVLQGQGIVPGIKVDMGTSPLALWPHERVAEGLDGLRERLAEYRELGARFAKWRAVFSIGEGRPSQACISANGHVLARYAALCQEAEMVPIVEPEVLAEGGHDVDACEEVTSAVLRGVFTALTEQGVLLEGMLLKPNMVLPGAQSGRDISIDEVAQVTLRCLRRSVPSAVPGIVFLSGGQSSELATARLNAMNAMVGPNPWVLSFSFGRALQEHALKAWRGNRSNAGAAQELLLRRARLNSQATRGLYVGELTPVPA